VLVTLPLLLASAVASQAPAEEASAALAPPALLQEVEPEYPEDAFADGVQGEVVLEVDIDATGSVSLARVVQAPDPRLSWSALGAATQLRFAPAQLGDEPVPVRINYSFAFTIEERQEERELAREDVEAIVAEEPAAAPVNFRGRVVVAAERRSVPGAIVWVEDSELEAISDEEGFFELRGAPDGAHGVHVEATGFEAYEVTESFAPNVVTEVVYYLRPAGGEDLTTRIRARRAQREVTKRVLTQQELVRVPGTFGDALRVVQRLPGVARAPFGLGAVVVRGGAPDDSTILIDGHLTRILFHLGAGPSVVSSDAIEQLELYPGGFGARFGRSHAGVVDVRTRDPNFETYSGAARVDLLQANFRLEGPALGGAFFFAGRRSYTAEVLNIGDLTARFVDLQGANFTLAPRYYDYQAKMAWRFGRHRLSFNLIGSDDVLDFAIDTEELPPTVPERTGINVGFHRFYPMYRFASARSHADGQPFFRFEASPMVEYTYSENRFDDSLFRLEVQRTGLRAEAELRLIEPWGITVGTDNVFGFFTFTTDVPFLLPDERLFPRPVTSDPPRLSNSGEVRGGGFSFYAQTDVTAGPLLVVAGLRTDLWTFYDEVRTVLDPRLTLRYDVTDFVTLKGNVGLYHKLPTPIELSDGFGNPNLPVEEGWQYGFGSEVWLLRSLKLDWQVFYRTLDKLPTFVRSPLAFEPSDEPWIQPVGQGRVFGTEVLLRQHLDHGLFGWIAYTLLRSERRFTDDDEPRWSTAPLDQTHILSIAASYQLPWGFELGAALRYVTGNPQTMAVGGVLDADRGRYLQVSGPPFGGRLPPFFQVDVRVDKRFVFDVWALALFIDLQNATNHTNFEFFTWSYDYRKMQGFPGLPILPVVGLEASF
jgi:TonB family protein